MLIAHGVVLKLFTFRPAGTVGFFESIGMPGLLAHVVFGMEAVGGILLVLGVCTQEVSAALLPILVGSSGCTRGTAGRSATRGSGWAYPAY